MTRPAVTTPTPEMWQSVISARLDSHPARKPPYTLIELIGMAILAHDEQAPTVGEIYEWVSTKFLYYNKGDTGWKNSIRHTLSIKDHFIQAGHPQPSIAGGGRTGRKSKTWKIDHRFRDHFRLEEVMEGGTTVWKLKYVPSKTSKVNTNHLGDETGGARAPSHVLDMSSRKPSSKPRSKVQVGGGKRRLGTIHEGDIPIMRPVAVPVVVTAPGPYAQMTTPMHPHDIGAYADYSFPSGKRLREEDDRGMLSFPSKEGLKKTEVYDEHDDQTLVYIPRYDKRPRRKASLAACDVLTSLCSSIQSNYQG